MVAPSSAWSPSSKPVTSSLNDTSSSTSSGPAAKLQSDHIVRVLDVGMLPGGFALISNT
jgi:hypothetical protein